MSVSVMMDQLLAPLMAEHHGALLRYLHARGADDADDLVQEVWLKISQVDLNKVDEPRAYLLRIAHNLMLDRARERRRRAGREQTFHVLQSGGETRSSREVDAERRLIEKEHLARINLALTACGTKTDTIFRRHRVDQVPQRQLALEFGLTLSAIEKQLQKAYRAVAAAERDYQAQSTAQEAGCDGRS